MTDIENNEPLKGPDGYYVRLVEPGGSVVLDELLVLGHCKPDEVDWGGMAEEVMGRFDHKFETAEDLEEHLRQNIELRHTYAACKEPSKRMDPTFIDWEIDYSAGKEEGEPVTICEWNDS